MIEGIRKGQYDAILAWHPDRLARNMKDAGVIIDLLDKKIIKDLQFVTFHFQNNSMGKVLLGIAFVLSKQYSDNLSDNVKRGIKRRILEGKVLNKPKHGYYKDINSFLQPDGRNFTLISKAWKMRQEGKTLDQIAEYLNEQGYEKATDNLGKNHKPFEMNKKRMFEVFTDPTYAGVLSYGSTNVNLIDIYDFTPIVTPDEYFAITKIDDSTGDKRMRSAGTSRERRQAEFMRGMIQCGICGLTMTAGITNKYLNSGKVNKYLYYRCDNKGCYFHGKSVKPQMILDFIVDFLRENNFTTEEAYNDYLAEMKSLNIGKNEELSGMLKSFNKRLESVKNTIEDDKKLLRTEEDETMKSVYKDDLKEALKKQEEIEGYIAQTKEELTKLKDGFLSFTEFLELFQKLPSVVENSKDLTERDFYIRKVFLNLTVNKEKVLSYQLNEPFAELIKRGFVTSNRDNRT